MQPGPSVSVTRDRRQQPDRSDRSDRSDRADQRPSPTMHPMERGGPADGTTTWKSTVFRAFDRFVPTVPFRFLPPARRCAWPTRSSSIANPTRGPARSTSGVSPTARCHGGASPSSCSTPRNSAHRHRSGTSFCPCTSAAASSCEACPGFPHPRPRRYPPGLSRRGPRPPRLPLSVRSPVGGRPAGRGTPRDLPWRQRRLDRTVAARSGRLRLPLDDKARPVRGDQFRPGLQRPEHRTRVGSRGGPRLPGGLPGAGPGRVVLSGHTQRSGMADAVRSAHEPRPQDRVQQRATRALLLVEAGFEVTECKGLNYMGAALARGRFDEVEASGNPGVFADADACLLLAVVARKPGGCNDRSPAPMQPTKAGWNLPKRSSPGRKDASRAGDWSRTTRTSSSGNRSGCSPNPADGEAGYSRVMGSSSRSRSSRRWAGAADRLLGLGGVLGGQVLADALVDLGHELGVLGQEVLDVLTALAELLTLVGEPGARLLDEAELHTDVEQRSLAADALAEGDVELGLLERRGALVLHDLDPGAVARPGRRRP